MSDQTTLEVVLSSASTVGNPIVEAVTVVGTVPVGPRGPTGPPGPPGPPGGGGGGGAVDSIVAGSNIDVDDSDPANPVVSVEALDDADIPATIARGSEVTAAVAAEATLARNADNLTSGTVADARVASTIARDSELTAAVAAEAAIRQAADDALDDTVAGLPELVADDAGEVDLATAGGVTTLTLTTAISRTAKTVNNQTANYTLAVVDVDAIVRMTSASALSVTYPQDSAVAIPVGASGVVACGSTGDVSMVAGTGATVTGTGTLYSAGTMARWIKVAANTFYVESIDAAVLAGFTLHNVLYNHDNIAASMALHDARLDKIVGQYYTTSHGLTSVSDTPSLNRLMYVPHMLAAGTIDTLMVDCQALQASSAARVGIYGTTSGLPGSLIAEFTTSTQLDLSTTGMKTATGTAVIPSAGLYWFACVIQGAAITTVRLRQVQDGPYGVNMPLGTTAPASAGALLAMRTESASGALPSTATVVAAGGVNAQPVRMFYKFSA